MFKPPPICKMVGSSKYAPLTNLPSQNLPTVVLPSNFTYKPSWMQHVEKQQPALQQQQTNNSSSSNNSSHINNASSNSQSAASSAVSNSLQQVRFFLWNTLKMLLLHLQPFLVYLLFNKDIPILFFDCPFKKIKRKCPK